MPPAPKYSRGGQIQQRPGYLTANSETNGNHNLNERMDSERSEVMAGLLDLCGPIDENSNANKNVTGLQRVFVRIYRTSVEHFAVLYPVRALVTACKPLATVNLRTCRVECRHDRVDRFRLSPPGTALALEFQIPKTDIDSKDKWLSSLKGDVVGEAIVASSGRVSPRKQLKSSTIGRLLPVLDEEEEQCI